MKGILKLTGDFRPGDLKELHGRVSNVADNSAVGAAFFSVAIDRDSSGLTFNTNRTQQQAALIINQIFGDMVFSMIPHNFKPDYRAESFKPAQKFANQSAMIAASINSSTLERRPVGYRLSFEKS